MRPLRRLLPSAALACVALAAAAQPGVEWTRVAETAEWGGRAGHRVAAFDGRLWLTGGVTTAGYMNDVWGSDNSVA